MTIGEELQKLTEYAKRYRTDAEASLKRSTHMNDIKQEDVIDQRIIDAILTDYINFVGLKHGCDYALYTCDLRK